MSSEINYVDLFQDEILHQFEELVTDIDWSLGLEIWRQFSDFPHAVDPFPKDPKVIEDLGLRASSQKKAEEARKKELEAGQASGDNNIDSKDDTLASNDNETKSEPASKKTVLTSSYYSPLQGNLLQI